MLEKISLYYTKSTNYNTNNNELTTIPTNNNKQTQ